jgi:hypothetical protein
MAWQGVFFGAHFQATFKDIGISLDDGMMDWDFLFVCGIGGLAFFLDFIVDYHPIRLDTFRWESMLGAVTVSRMKRIGMNGHSRHTLHPHLARFVFHAHFAMAFVRV